MPEPFIPARTIEEVINRLDDIISFCVKRDSRLAYFPALYRDVTDKVKSDIGEGRFQDGERMERLDVNFANRYLLAWHRYRQNQPTARCWSAAFEAGESWSLLILQHLVLGMNAHINFDLGIAAAKTCPGDQLAGLKRDFDEITALLGEMLDDVQGRIARVSPWMGLLDKVGARTDEQLFSFALRGARDMAWRTAERFAVLDENSAQSELKRLDQTVARLAHPISHPGSWISTVLLIMRIRESSDVDEVVQSLRMS